MAFPYRAEPMSNQRSALKRAWRKPAFALFHEMGTGKTFTTINLAAGRYDADLIQGVIVLCPTPIKMVWESEFEKWCPFDYDLYVLQAGKASQNAARTWIEQGEGNLRVLVVGIEALSQGKAIDVCMEFVNKYRCMAVADESSRLKNSTSIRTKRAIKIAEKCPFRLILTGTPITQGIHDLFGQFQFLDPGIIGMRNFTKFRNRYCIMGGFENRNIVGYQNTPELMKRISSYVDIVKKEDVLDLPPKMYETIHVSPSKEQSDLIEQLKGSFEAEHADEFLVTETILERLTRFQQIIGGHFPFNEDDGTYGIKPIEGKNPKLDALLEWADDFPRDRKAIIWARFVPEIELIRDALRAKFGDDTVVTFYGKDEDEDRKRNVFRFKEGDARFIVSNPQLGGMGQTWVAATAVVYYSNSFSYENRQQSEDRAHRKGQEHPVTYLDIEANHRYDKMILTAIRHKQSVAQYVEEQIEAFKDE